MSAITWSSEEYIYVDTQKYTCSGEVCLSTYSDYRRQYNLDIILITSLFGIMLELTQLGSSLNETKRDSSL